MTYNILESGSRGNATIIEDTILIDCGVSFKKLQPFYRDLKLVLLTHIHSDHFNKKTIQRLAKERPTLRFGCGFWLVSELVECGISIKNIDVYERFAEYDYEICNIGIFELFHDVPNCGYKISINNQKVFYATDTSKIDHAEAPNFDLYLIEGNYEDEVELELRKAKNIENGRFSYEDRVKETHLSREKATEWLLKNMGDNSQYIFMHQHIEKINL